MRVHLSTTPKLRIATEHYGSVNGEYFNYSDYQAGAKKGYY